MQRREPLRRLVEEQHARVGQQRAPDRDHLLLAAGELVAAMPAPLLQPWEQVVDIVERPLAPAGPPVARRASFRFSSTVSRAKIRRP